MTSRVIALDLDGTLLTSTKTILPASLEALSKAKEAGYQILIVTGRHHVAIHPFYQALALDTPAICCNGTYLYDYQAKKVLEADPLSLSQALQMIEMLNAHDVHGLMYVENAMLYERLAGHITRGIEWAATLPEAQRPVFNQVDSFAAAARQTSAIWKFALTDENSDRLNAFAEQVEETLGLECERSWIYQIDVARKGNSKGNRLARWVESQGLSMKDVVAFGDNFNDISMLEAAGTGVAMGNAADEVKARANVVIGGNEDNSIADYIYTHLL
ncbi:pyridoxal phosphatase [Enterobacteriaceae bacterium RIT691]|nr:pyridoxal phosphatase [Enterobacteriaceae bacterium RIT691]